MGMTPNWPVEATRYREIQGMKRIVIVAAVAAMMLAGAQGAMAQQVIGNPNAIVNGNFTVNGGHTVNGSFAMNLNTNVQFLRIKAKAAPQIVLGVQPAAQAVNVIQYRVDGSGNPEIRLTDTANTFLAQIFATQSSYLMNGLSLGTANAQGNMLKVNGTASVNVLEITGGSDLAERFNTHEDFEPGTVLCIDADNPGMLKMSSTPYDRTVAGVVSGAAGLNTGLVLGQEAHPVTGATAVALTGRVYVKADATQGAIVPGDLLTTSSIPGHAMKVTDYGSAHGAIIGKAMSKLDSGTGMVLVLVGLQ